MLSTSLFNQNGTHYDQDAVFGTTFTLNQTALQEIGLPALTGMTWWTYSCGKATTLTARIGSNAWNNLCQNLSVCHL